MELFDIELNLDISSKLKIHTLDPLTPSKNSPYEALVDIQNTVKQILNLKKFPVTLGGEHSITYGAVKAISEKYKNLSILDLDAHTDLRNKFEGTKYHHATVMRRIYELGHKITQVGIRSTSTMEIEFIKKNPKAINIFYAPRVPTEKIINTLSKNVYITIDLDCFDPSIMPSTGTPEPNGLNWQQITSLLRSVSKTRNIVGFDMVELSPIPGIIHPEFLAAKLTYKLMGYSAKL